MRRNLLLLRLLPCSSLLLALGACAGVPTGPLDTSRPPPAAPPPLLAIAPGAAGRLALIAERAESPPLPSPLPFRSPPTPHLALGLRSGVSSSALLRFDLSPLPAEAQLREATLVLTSLGERYGASQAFVTLTLLPDDGGACAGDVAAAPPEHTLTLPLQRQLHIDRLDVTPLLQLARDLRQPRLCLALTYLDAAEFWKSWGGASTTDAPAAPRLEIGWEG